MSSTKPASGHIDPVSLASRVGEGNRQALAAALNLLDDHRPSARVVASEFLSELQRVQPIDKGHLVGITGPPGVGKSSLTAALISLWRSSGLRVAVLAVDPSSPLSGGALLGDRLRMKTSAEDDGVFVRSLADRGEFGGLSAEVWPMSLVMMAAFDIVVIETVGVGQREIDVSRMCDTTCYVAQPGSGDSVQFLKAGILEVPHVLVVNKQDMGAVARRTLSELSGAMTRGHLGSDWQVPVLSVSATLGSGIAELGEALQGHLAWIKSTGGLESRRFGYQRQWIVNRLQQEFGDYGLELLGGESGVDKTLKTDKLGLFEHYEQFRKTLLKRFDAGSS